MGMILRGNVAGSDLYQLEGGSDFLYRNARVCPQLDQIGGSDDLKIRIQLGGLANGPPIINRHGR